MNTAYKKQMEEMGGIYLKDKLGVEEWAFNREDALKLLEDRRSKNIACSGGDVIVEDESGKFSYPGANWYCQSDQFKTTEEYVEGSFKKASDYINNFSEKPDHKYFYVLV